MILSRRSLLGAAPLAALAPAVARAQAPVIRVGVLGDASGPYRDLSGAISVACAQQAVAEFMADHDIRVELVSGDHQNKPDVASAIARQWFDRDGVDMITDMPNSACALAVSSIAKDKNRIMITTGAGTTALTGKDCNANTLQWVYDTYMLSRSTGGAMVKQGGDKWFFITADYAFGKSLQDDASVFVKKFGGSVLGAVATPFPSTTDFSSFLLQAQGSGANVLGLANAGGDTINCVKQAREFGLRQNGMQIAALLMQLPDVKALGPEVAQGLFLTESFYWDLNDRTRAFTERVRKRVPNVPCMGPAGCYAGTMHFLKAIADLGPQKAKGDGAAVVARMKAMSVDDDVFGRYRIRQDGRVLTPAFLFQVKSPAESKSEWDLYKIVTMTPGDEAYRPLDQGSCPLIKS